MFCVQKWPIRNQELASETLVVADAPGWDFVEFDAYPVTYDALFEQEVFDKKRDNLRVAVIFYTVHISVSNRRNIMGPRIYDNNSHEGLQLIHGPVKFEPPGTGT
jgi:hypothetical protein